MSVVAVKPAPGRSGDNGLQNDSKSRLLWTVITNNKLDDDIAIRNYCQTTQQNGQYLLPTPYVSFHPSQPNYLCQNLTLRQQRDNPLIWDCEATYGTQPVSQLDLDMQEAPDPIIRPASISWSTQSYQKACLKDINGKPLVNSAGDPFIPPVEFTLNRWVANVTKNVLAVPTWILDYESAVNSDSFTIDGVPCAAQKARLSGLSISELKRDKIATGVVFNYRTISFRIEFSREGWKLKVLDQGYRYIDGNNRKPITEDDTAGASRPVTTPRRLDGRGQKQSNPTADNAEFLSFDAYPLKPFNGYLPLN